MFKKSSCLIDGRQQGGEDAALLKACSILPPTRVKYAPRPLEKAQGVGKAVGCGHDTYQNLGRDASHQGRINSQRLDESNSDSIVLMNCNNEKYNTSFAMIP